MFFLPLNTIPSFIMVFFIDLSSIVLQVSDWQYSGWQYSAIRYPAIRLGFGFEGCGSL